MRRSLFAAAIVAMSAAPAAAQLAGDFDCVSDLSGPDTPAGTLRIESATSWSFLTDAAVPGPLHRLDFIDADIVIFGDELADHISPGAIVLEAHLAEAEFTYAGSILTSDGREVSFSCPYIP